MKHLLGIEELGRDEIEMLLATAEEMHDVQSRPIKKVDLAEHAVDLVAQGLGGLAELNAILGCSARQ